MSVDVGVSAFEEQVARTARSYPYARLTLIDWLRLPQIHRARVRESLPQKSFVEQSLRRQVPIAAARRPRVQFDPKRARRLIAEHGAEVVFDARTAPRTVAVLQVAQSCVTLNDRAPHLGLAPTAAAYEQIVGPVRQVFDETVHQATVVVYGEGAGHGPGWFPGWQAGDESPRVEEFEVLYAAALLLSQMTMTLQAAWSERYPLRMR